MQNENEALGRNNVDESVSGERNKNHIFVHDRSQQLFNGERGGSRNGLIDVTSASVSQPQQEILSNGEGGIRVIFLIVNLQYLFNTLRELNC